MTIHKEGYVTILITVLFIAVLTILIHKLFPSSAAAKWAVYIFSFLLLVTILQFFRSPNRKTIVNENHIIAPADGETVVIEETEEPEYFKDKRIQVSIFMSPINVHVNRYPIGGVVKYAKYHPGQYLVAWHPKSSTLNERTSIVVEQKGKGEILFRQIAGALARRIVFYSKEGETITQGNEFGFIKFGSRVDLFLPKHAVIKVKLNQKVVGGETVIAEF